MHPSLSPDIYLRAMLAVALCTAPQLACCQRSILFYEPDYSARVALYDAVRASTSTFPLPYESFYSAAMLKNGVRQMKRTELRRENFYNVRHSDSLVATHDFDRQGFLVRLRCQYFHDAVLQADTLSEIRRSGTAFEVVVYEAKGRQLEVRRQEYQFDSSGKLMQYRFKSPVRSTMLEYRYDSAAFVRSARTVNGKGSQAWTVEAVEESMYPTYPLYSTQGCVNPPGPDDSLGMPRYGRDSFAAAYAPPYYQLRDSSGKIQAVIKAVPGYLYCYQPDACQPARSIECQAYTDWFRWDGHGSLLVRSRSERLVSHERQVRGGMGMQLDDEIRFCYQRDASGNAWRLSVASASPQVLLRDGLPEQAAVDGVEYKYYYLNY